MSTRLLGLAGLILLVSVIACAQEYRSPQWNGCIGEFYDASMYNWLAYTNSCGERLNVVFIPYHPGYGGSSMEIAPGGKGSTGFSRREVDQKGGFEVYACPSGYVPVDGQNQYVNRVNTQFRCKKQ